VIVFNLRVGIGFDIEYNDDICHIVIADDTEEEEVVAFEGILIKVPFFSIYIGDFYDLEG
jgi:hypothetical protein